MTRAGLVARLTTGYLFWIAFRRLGDPHPWRQAWRFMRIVHR